MGNIHHWHRAGKRAVRQSKMKPGQTGSRSRAALRTTQLATKPRFLPAICLSGHGHLNCRGLSRLLESQYLSLRLDKTNRNTTWGSRREGDFLCAVGAQHWS
jgi:hypothetical protein